MTSSTVGPTGFRVWNVPTAEIPVRGRVRPTVPDRPFDPYHAAAFLAAASVTTGTVVVQGWPRPTGHGTDGAADDRIRHLLAGLGVYVVRTAEGLTATSRSTSGDLRGGRFDLTGMPRLVPLALVLAALAEGPSTLIGPARTAPAALAAVEALRTVGGAADWTGDGLLVHPRRLTGALWVAAGDVDVALAGIVLGLTVPGVRLDDLSPVIDAIPAFDDLWLRLLWADEHLLPGTSAAH
ncbi:hypothetical protein FDO65_14935 [Nakamurella flava]|uniref:Enolpyruvate transferase domain-containing protein n=1 Tax=Nakamurella flava TaxID=2576308 RepID=A0A4U6QFN3_9ACTN|nr:hypothetical protein [Nakamurella flava]TKV58799.1 hypothetical protein FDO65_14935 [Nakamurella flava]